MNLPQVCETELRDSPEPINLEEIFNDQYDRIARLIAAITRNPARAEELAVDVFLRWNDSRIVDFPQSVAWLHRAAAHAAIDEVRRQIRRERLDRMIQVVRVPKTPEEIHLSDDRHNRVAKVLASLNRRDADLLILRGQDLKYEHIASALSIKVTSVGTLLARAQASFRKEYIKRYGISESA